MSVQHHRVHLHGADVSVLLEIPPQGMPTMVHWGPSLGHPTQASIDALCQGIVTPVGHNAVDEPVIVGLIPSQAAAYSGQPGLTGSRGGRAWSPQFSLVTTQVRATADESGPAQVVMAYRDDDAGLSLDLTVELDRFGLLRSRAVLTNVSDDPEPYQVDRLVLAYPVPGEARELLDFAGRWGQERVPQRHSFTVGTHLRENRRGRTGADSAYVLHAGTRGFGFEQGHVWGVHTAWSGNHVHYAELTFDGLRVLGGGELLLPGEIRLATGESYSSPWIYGSYGVGLDQVAHRFHRYLRAQPKAVGTDRPVTLNVWEAVYFDHDKDRLIDLADRAAALGVERYVLDDGWFGSRRDDFSGLGDWVVSKEVWPDGLHPLIDHVKKLGMQFGLWFEPEMVNPDSDVARAHPEWILSARPEWPVLSRHQQVLNLTIPEAYAHVRDQMRAVLDEYAIDYIKWDHNRDLVEAGSQPAGGRPVVHEQTLAFYRLVDELKAAYPGLEIESCSSGGGRVDLEVLERTDRVWVSDCIDPLERQMMMRWTTQLIPPERMGSHIASGVSHTTGRWHRLGFRAATAVFGHLGIEWDLAKASEDELTELAEWIAFYKQHRELLLNGDLLRIDGLDDNVWQHGVVAHDRSKAILALVFTGEPKTLPGSRLRWRGLDPDARYRVQPLTFGAGWSGMKPPPWWGEAEEEFPGIEITGGELEHVGVAPPVMHPDQVVLFEAVMVQPV